MNMLQKHNSGMNNLLKKVDIMWSDMYENLEYDEEFGEYDYEPGDGYDCDPGDFEYEYDSDQDTRSASSASQNSTATKRRKLNDSAAEFCRFSWVFFGVIV